MIEYILGDYLVSTGKITQEQLTQILDNSDKIRVKLGLIAVSENLMSVAQADEVNRLQTVMDKRFGDIAVEMGYLTAQQVEDLLQLQGNGYLVFIQNLVDNGMISISQVDGILENFKSDNDFSNAEMEDLKSGDPDRIIPLYLPMDAVKYRENIGIAVRTIIRLIDRKSYIEKAQIYQEFTIEKAVLQKIEGEDCIINGLMDDNGGFLELASKFAKEEFSEIDDDVMDACGEFLNCISGLYASAKSKKSIELELYPPEFQTESKVMESAEICVVPIHVNSKKLYYIVSM